MIEFRDGGPAFPVAIREDFFEFGMSIRDYFAAKAMQVFIANNDTDWDQDVQDAYAIADKMLKEREKR